MNNATKKRYAAKAKMYRVAALLLERESTRRRKPFTELEKYAALDIAGLHREAAKILELAIAEDGRKQAMKAGAAKARGKKMLPQCPECGTWGHTASECEAD